MSVRSGYKQTELGEIPEEWSVKTLLNAVGDNKSLIVGGPFGSNLKVEHYRDSGIPIIRLQNIDFGAFVEKDIKFISQEKAEELRYHSFKKGDIVLAKLGDPLGKTCIVPNHLEKGIVVADVVRIRNQNPEVDDKFLMFALNSFHVYQQLRKEVIGSTRPRVNITQVRELFIPMPSFAEQQEIASVLSTVDESIQKSDQIITKTQQFKTGLMQQLFTRGIGAARFKQTELGVIPERWDLLSLSEVFKLTSGKSRPRTVADKQTIKLAYPVYGGNGVIGFSDIFLIDRETLVIGRVGEYCGSVHKAPKHSWITDNALYIAEMVKSDVSLDFLNYLLSFMNLNSYQARSGQPLVTQTLLGSIRAAFPPLSEQHRIASILSLVDEKIEKENQRKEQLEHLKKGLVDELLTGKVRVKVT